MMMQNRDIKIIVMDVDGTLTDGTINIGNDGEIFKGFYCRDGLAIMSAQKAGIVPIILTSRESKIVKKRAEELNIEIVMQGAKQSKYSFLKEYMFCHDIERNQVAYIGDDRNDLEAMTLAGIVGCPHDAIDSVKQVADFISDFDGGHGAVRDFIDWILNEPRMAQISPVIGEKGK